MPDITLIRHGQANNAAIDENGYDRLSDLGRQQLRWLGEHMRGLDEHFDHFYAGALTRHRQSAEEWGVPEGALAVDERLNEVRYFELSALMHAQYGLAHPRGHDAFIDHLPLTFSAWQEGRIEGASETFATFQARVADALADIAATGGRSIVFTSGGLIGMATRVAMGLEMGPFTRVILPILNSSVHRFASGRTGLTLTQFNAVPHLERPGRLQARTHY